MADLWLHFDFKDSSGNNYYRDLDLNTAISTVRFKVNNVAYTRTTFISYPDKVLMMYIQADRKGAVNFSLGVTSKLKNKISVTTGGVLTLAGKAPKHVAHRASEPEQVVYDDWKGEGTNFEVQAKIVIEGSGNVENGNDKVIVTDADAVTVYLASATSFKGFDKSPGLEGRNLHVEVESIIKAASRQTFAQIAGRHISDYQQLFKRVSFHIHSKAPGATLPTDERLKKFSTSPDDFSLQTLYYQFGRYLMIAGSRNSAVPTNLQGIWNDKVQPPWGSNYTININTQMNYWLAESSNLSECHYPLISFIKNLSVNGAITAKDLYGIREGWVAHHNSDIRAKTAPAGGMGWKDPVANARFLCWPMAGAWLGTHLWEHYLYNGNFAYLKDTAYPLMKGAALFMKYWLVKDPQSGYWVTNPSTSPENTAKADGREYDISMATTMDMAIIREIFSDFLKAAQLLKADTALTAEIRAIRSALYPYHIGKYGQLQEWYKDWDDPKDKHRHLSHLFGLFPGTQISNVTTPDLAAAAKRSLIFRGDVSTGWSMAWKVNCWARLQDGDRAYEILKDAFTYIDPNARLNMTSGGTYPNLFDAHPPFQIDGNFGATAGMTEMLMQSHEGYISLLPALPFIWRSGSITGIKARGGFQIDIDWENGRLRKSEIYSVLGGTCRIRTLRPVKVLEVQIVNTGLNNMYLNVASVPEFINSTKEKLESIDSSCGYIIEFITEPGKKYTVTPL